MNEYDSEVIASSLDSWGARQVKSEKEADIIILNTCCVRDTADNKVYGKLGQLKQLKREKPELMLIVCGCLAQKDREGMLERFPQVDLVLGTHNLQDLVPLIEEVRNSGPIARVDEDGTTFLTPKKRGGTISAYVPISIGCDCFCTFCIVPYVRGRFKSRPIDEIITEVENLAARGVREVFLLGQNVNTYGQDLPGAITFASLLKRINSIEGPSRIRFTSPHPRDFSDELIEAVGQLEKVCEWVHLPLQSGSDSVLERMNRKYDTARFKDIVEKLRKAVPGIAISTDIIVGFPGETDREFEESLEFIKQMQFDQAYMFAYSTRSGTAASKMPGHLPRDVKMQRLYQLIDMQNDISRSLNRNEVGKVVDVLAEGTSKKDSNRITGRTRTNKVVNFPGEPDLAGQLVNVELTEAYTWGFMGEQVPYQKFD